MCTYFLHNLQICLRNAVQNVLGEDNGDDNGDYVKNVMQMLHGAYNLQNWQETKESKELWKYLSSLDNEDITFKNLKSPL